MRRLEMLLKFIDRTKPGIEIAPYFNPALSKRDGNNVLILDVFDTDTLHKLAREDDMIPEARINEIEEVDIVGDASRIGEIVAATGQSGEFAYVVSSHNFEHLPNPILFLQGVYDVLAPGGMLSMAVPDNRACFDHFRFPSRLADWLAAYHEDRAQPSPETVFDAMANTALYYRDNETPQPGCHFSLDRPDHYRAQRRLDEAFAEYGLRKAEGGAYRDSHCNVFFPETLELMLRDLRALGLIKLDVVEITQPFGHEFFIHLRKGDGEPVAMGEAFYDRRQQLLRRIADNLGGAPYRRGLVSRRIISALNDLRVRIKNAGHRSRT